jgi:HAD superfamily hydrolase (TIGR01509 family)
LPSLIDAVVFDLDGVLVDTEPLWAQVRRRLVADTGGHWDPAARTEMMGMSSAEWSRYMHDRLGVPLPPDQISAAVVRALADELDRGVPLLPGAEEAVVALAARWPLGLASSANRPVIDLVLERTGLRPHFRATVSSEEVAHGKPAPDVYMEATRRLDAPPERCVAVEDSTNGIASARAAGLRVVAVPNRATPPTPDALQRADVVLDSLVDLDPAVLEPLGIAHNGGDDDRSSG